MVIKRQCKSAVLENKKDKAIKGKRRAHNKTKIRRKNKVMVGDDFSSNKNPNFKLVPKFLNNAIEDILLEIFVRLPNYRSAILFSSVCRSWHHMISHPHFMPSFVRHHQDRYILPCTIIFRSSDIYAYKKIQYYQPLCKPFSEESTFLHEKASSSSRFLDFMPSPMIIRASFDDLLLVSRDRLFSRHYYICNPVTKQWFQLPRVPKKLVPLGFALVCVPDDGSNKQLGAQYQYKVVLIAGAYPIDNVVESKLKINVDTFCSKSGRWHRSFFLYPTHKEFKFNTYLEVVTCNGILYWQENESNSARIIALDLFNGPRCSVIDTPEDLGQDSCGKTHLGVVRGELRLLHVFNTIDEEECCFVMKVWELKCNKDDSTSWVLVHKINLGANNTKKMVRGLAVHPNNDDVVFMIWGKHLFKYTITQDIHELVDKFKQSICSSERVLSIPLVHPAWPTSIPSHPPHLI